MTAADVDAGSIANAQIFGYDADGVPNEGIVRLDVTADDSGWYFDSVHPTDDPEFSSVVAQFMTDTGIDDPNSVKPGNLATLNVDGGSIDATFTLADPGHLYEGPFIPSRPDIPIHPLELISPGRNLPANRRVLISDEMALILQKVYGYDVALSSTFSNLMVNSNHFTEEGGRMVDAVVR